MPWVLRGLREGIVTTRYPKRPDDYGGGFEGAVTVLTPQDQALDLDELVDLAALCPTGAIEVHGEGTPSLRLDRGRCILCGCCVTARPQNFRFEPTVENAATARRLLVARDSDPDDADIEDVRRELLRRVKALRRSIHIRHVDSGSDGAEEAEISALTNPVYDMQRLGMFFTATPRHADILLTTGVVTAGMESELRRTFDAMPDPKVVVAVGTDAVSGGLIGPAYAARGGVGDVLPVDIWIPGSPPSPFSLLHGLLLAVGLLPDRRDQR